MKRLSHPCTSRLRARARQPEIWTRLLKHSISSSSNLAGLPQVDTNSIILPSSFSYSIVLSISLSRKGVTLKQPTKRAKEKVAPLTGTTPLTVQLQFHNPLLYINRYLGPPVEDLHTCKIESYCHCILCSYRVFVIRSQRTHLPSAERRLSANR